MTYEEKIERIKRNIFHLAYSMDDAPYHGVTSDNIIGVKFAINKILEGTDMTSQEIHAEFINQLTKEENK